MPPVIIGIAVGVAAAGAVTVGAAIAIGVAAAAFSYAMMPSVSAPSFSNEAYAQQQMLRSPSEARRGIYGRSMVSGPLIFVEETGSDNEYLHLVIALAGHQCDAIEEVYFGDDLAWTPATGMKGKYRNYAMVKAHLGDQTTADSTLVSQCQAWTDKHIGHGVTYLYVRLKHNNDVFPNGVPNIKALVKGKRVYDPRLDSNAGGNGSHRLDDDSTWEWSENWALCVLDYTCFESGVGALPSEVDFASYANAANDSDSQVEYQSEEFERRYCCNGTYNQDTSPASVLEKLLSAGAGMQVYVGGKYHLYAGVYQGPAAITLSEDDCAGEIDVRPYTPRASLCNAVRGTFVDPDNFYQPTDFSPYESAYYRAQDNDEYIDHDLDLPFTQSNWAAQRLAKLHLEMNRAGMQITFPCKMIGLAVSVGTVVQLQLPELGINGTFMVADWVFDYGKPVKLILRESTPAIFDFAMGSYTQRDLASNTYLPNPSNVPTVRNLVWQELGDDANWQGVLSWSAPGENSSYRYRLEVTNTTGDLVYQANPDIPRHHIPKLDAGSYNISLWAVNMFANRSNVAAMLSIGASAPPPITGIEVIAGPLELLLRPNTSALIANSTEFELRGSLANDFGGTSVLGQGKEVIWPSRNPNTSHYIWARCVNNFGNSAWFGPVLAQTSDDPTAIVNLIENEIGVRLGAYTWFAWADDAAGTGFTTDKTLSDGKSYMGVANEKTSASPSGNYQEYAWSKISADIGNIFTPSEEAALDNLMAGKLPGGSKDLLALQDALNNSSLSNDLLDANKLLSQGINAGSLGGETPAGAQAKADEAATANSAIELNAVGSVVIQGNRVTKDNVVIGDYAARVYSTQSFVGGCAMSCIIEGGNAGTIDFMIGLNAVVSDAIDYGSDYYIIHADNSIYNVKVGATVIPLTHPAPTVGDVLSVIYDGVNAKYLINGVVVYTTAVPANKKFYLDSAYTATPCVLSNIQLQPLSNLNDALASAALDALNQANTAQQNAIAASVDIELITTGQVVATGRSVARTATPQGDWSSQAYSKESFTGGAVASCTIASGGTGAIRFMFGLNTDPKSSASYSSIDYAIYPGNDRYNVYEGGSSKGMVLSASPAVGDTLVVAYDGTQVKYFINGTVVRTVSAPADLKLYIDSSFTRAAAGISNISLQPLSNLNDALISASADAQAKANAAEANASNYALSSLNSRMTLAESEQMKNSLSLSGLAHYQRLIVYGDSNKYYPVIITGGNQDINRNIKIWRAFNEQGPSDWYTSTHKASLTMHWEGSFGGWGGGTYKSHLVQNASAYVPLLADLYRCNHSMSYCFMLRGGGSGGAVYHLGSDQALNATPYYNQDKYYDSSNNSYDSYAPAPVTSLNNERINSTLMGNITIQNLIAYSAQFTQLKSKLASFGGLTAETIAALSIATNHLQASAVVTDKLSANAVTADKLQVDTALIQKLIADQALFNQVQAQFGMFGGLTANAIAAKAITTEKLDVRARNLVNNFTATGETTGWPANPLVNHTHGGQIVKVMSVTSSGNYQGFSDFFDIDHSKIYEVNFTFYRKSGGSTGTRYFGMSATGGPDTSVQSYNAETRVKTSSSNSNFYFWSGDISTGQIRHIRGYIIGADVDPAAVPDSLSTGSICQLKPGTKQVRLRALNYYNAGYSTTDYWINPSVTEMGGGIISANQLLANSALFNTLKAKLGSFGGLTANELFVDTALITKLVGTSALFNQLVAQMATFGGLTANAISADAIESRHIKANQLIESPIIQGGEFRLIGTGYMKVMRATAFGPDGLVEWYGPKLLSGTTPNWNALKKSNAITYLSSDGDAYFGGTLSAGVLKNGIATSDKNRYFTNSYPVTVGPFGSNGKRKSVIVSFSYDGYSSTGSNPGNIAQPKITWQLQRKIGSGGWAAVSNGTFTGTVSSEYDGESRQYFVREFCSGSSTYVDNHTSTSDFNYRIKVISVSRYHATSNVRNQILSLYSTE